MATEKELFDLVHGIGETLTGDLHVINMSDGVDDFRGEEKFRVYHSKGYCFDIEKLVNEVDDEADEVISYEYYVYDEWDGFEKLDFDGYIKLINNSQNGTNNK